MSIPPPPLGIYTLCINYNNLISFFVLSENTNGKKILKPENRLKRIRLISFAHVWLYFTGIKTICSFLKLNCYNFYLLYISLKGGGRLTYFLKLFIHSGSFILIIFLIYRRKFCVGHIILVFFFHFMCIRILPFK